MKSNLGSAVKNAYRLKPALIDRAKQSGHWMVKDLGTILTDYQNAFSRYRKIDFKFVTTEDFCNVVEKQKLGKKDSNILLLSHLVRIAEAYQIVSVWRVTELLAPAVRALNSNEILAAGVLCRSMLEMAIVFALETRFIRGAFLKFSEHEMQEIQVKDEVETRFVRLIEGSRDREEGHPLYSTNITTQIKKIQKIANKTIHPLDIDGIYSRLSEISHPNRAGYQRFVQQSHFDENSRWHTWDMRIDASGGIRDNLVDDCLWALAFTQWVMIENVQRIDEGKRAYLEVHGRPLP